MRSIALRYESSSDLLQEMELAPGPGLGATTLPVPLAERVAEGEWVLAVVETQAEKRTAAAAAVGRKIDGKVVLGFGDGDWERLGGLTVPQSTRPRSTSLPPEVVEAPPASLRTPGIRIALVDHDDTTRAELDETLRAQGLDVVAFSSETEALADTGPLHAAVVSYGPGASALAKKMREAHPSGLPVLFVSAQRCSREIVEAYACGCDDYLARPFRGAELGARVLGLLRRSFDAYR